jgi:hypothetical protein
MIDLHKPLLAALALAGAALPWSAPAKAQTHHDGGCLTQPCTRIDGVAPIYFYNPLGEQYLTSTQLQSATFLSIPTGATIAQICVETAGVRYRENGRVPTASIGMPIVPASSSLPFCFQYAASLTTVQFIAISGSPTMDIFYYAAN